MCCIFASADQRNRTIRFTTTADGVDIAFWEIDEGEPVVIVPNLPLCHAELEWTVPSMASFYLEMAERYRVIRFDARGFGLSGEPPGGWGATTASGGQQGLSTSEMGLDISAVASALDLEHFNLMGISVQGIVAIDYTATHPAVSGLLLCNAFPAIATSFIVSWEEASEALEIASQGDGPRFSIWESHPIQGAHATSGISLNWLVNPDARRAEGTSEQGQEPRT